MAGSEVDMLWTELLLVLTEVGSTAAKKAIVASSFFSFSRRWDRLRPRKPLWLPGQRGLPQVLDGTGVLEGEHPFGLEVPCWKGTVVSFSIEGRVRVLHT